MNEQLTKAFLDSCHHIKYLDQYLPPLPDGITPRALRLIDTIYQLSDSQSLIRISDIASVMNSTLPSITRLVAAMEELSLIEKMPSTEDKRVTYIQLTQKGLQFHQEYIKNFHNHLQTLLQDISEAEFKITITVLNRVYDLIKNDLHFKQEAKKK